LGLLEYRAPLFLLSILFMIIGTQFLTLGLLGELIVKLYYSSGEKKIYNIEKVLQKPVQGKLRKDAKKMKNLMEILT
jgi:hypothetical protein